MNEEEKVSPEQLFEEEQVVPEQATKTPTHNIVNFLVVNPTLRDRVVSYLMDKPRKDVEAGVLIEELESLKPVPFSIPVKNG